MILWVFVVCLSIHLTDVARSIPTHHTDTALEEDNKQSAQGIASSGGRAGGNGQGQGNGKF